MDREICSSATGFETEVCPYCGNEITLKWDVQKQGFKAACTNCGNRLMLCDACAHRYGYYVDDCNYNSITDKCRFNK